MINKKNILNHRYSPIIYFTSTIVATTIINIFNLKLKDYIDDVSDDSYARNFIILFVVSKFTSLQSLSIFLIMLIWGFLVKCKEGKGDGKDKDNNYTGNHGTENDFICKIRKPTMYISLFTSVISGGIWLFMVNLLNH